LVNIIVLNEHAPTKDKSDDTKDIFMRKQSVYSTTSLSATWRFC